MNGAVLIFSLCLKLVATPYCIEKRVPMQEASVTTCLAQAQTTIAKWFDEEPQNQGWAVDKWRCVEAGEEDDLL